MANLTPISTYREEKMFDDGLARSISDAPPAHYIVKIQFFSLLTKNSVERYESGDFEAGGYKWKLILYPNGNKKKNVKDHVSLYVAIAEASSLRPGWEVYAVFRFFLLDQNKDNYFTLQDAMGNGRRFHGMKLEWGFDQFISLTELNDARIGYLVDDNCVLGAEVFVSKEKSRGIGESLSMIKEAISYKHFWKIENFSELDEEYYESITFNAGDKKWKIKLYPEGEGTGAGSHLSLYLVLARPTALPPGFKIFADFQLRILDLMNAKHQFARVSHWFSASSPDRGWPRFITQSSFNQPNMGFLMKDTCWVEAEITILGVAEALDQRAMPSIPCAMPSRVAEAPSSLGGSRVLGGQESRLVMPPSMGHALQSRKGAGGVVKV